jgi:peptidoglycan/LPS O-acetylase OafA/YrhL
MDASSVPAPAAITAPARAPATRPARSLAYRPDIDGLRAVAVLSVLGYHLGLHPFVGGFVGVDIFFVISGYLIGSILLSDLERGRFSLREFYVRRIRRIFPALFVAMLGTTALALFFCVPSELVDFAKSLVTTAFSASNLYFARTSNYFDIRAIWRPALQTWSLGVEEQFYIFFPPLLWLLHRRMPRRLPAVLGALAVGSFALSVVGVFRFPIATFFLPFSRACELLLGALLALPGVPVLKSRIARNVLAWAGLAMIAVAVHFYFPGLPFPGVLVLLPCLGSALLIWTGMSRAGIGPAPAPGEAHTLAPTIPARLLALRPVVFIGLISYSLYLWHWPIILFQAMGALWGDGLPLRVAKLITLAVSLTLATLSWRFVEQPFREGRFKLAGRGAFRFACVSIAILTALGATIVRTHGLPGRFPPAVSRVAAYVNEPMNYRIDSCMVIKASEFEPGVCLRMDPTRQNWLLVGDSHAAALWQGLVKALPQVNFLQDNRAACHPDPAQTDGDCGVLMQQLFGHFLVEHPVDRIIAVARWAPGDVETVDRLVAWARAHHTPVTLIGPVQEYDSPLPRLLAFSIMRHDPGLAYRHREPQSWPTDQLYAEYARTRWHIPYISLVQMFCTPDACQTYVDGSGSAPLLLDEDHFSNEASVMVGQRMVDEHLLPAVTREVKQAGQAR